MSVDTELDPELGSPVRISHGRLTGITGNLIKCVGKRWVIQPHGCAWGILLIVDSAGCELDEGIDWNGDCYVAK
jgi:hypothetical protein